MKECHAEFVIPADVWAAGNNAAILHQAEGSLISLQIMGGEVTPGMLVRLRLTASELRPGDPFDPGAKIVQPDASGERAGSIFPTFNVRVPLPASTATPAPEASAIPIRALPAVDPRVETGPAQFGFDWPGVFIRGDNAAYFAMHLRTVLDGRAESDPLALLVVRGLLATLDASNLTLRAPQAGNE